MYEWRDEHQLRGIKAAAERGSSAATLTKLLDNHIGFAIGFATEGSYWADSAPLDIPFRDLDPLEPARCMVEVQRIRMSEGGLMGFLVRMYARLAARLRPPFVTVRADDGSVVMMDQRTVDFLESEEPLPTQASLNLLLHGVTRLNITKVGERTTLLDVPDREALASLADCLRIDEPSERFHCMCIGDENLTFYGPEGRRGVITLHHGQSIRWDGIWGSDAMLSEPARLLSWLAERGLDAPLRAYEEERGEAEQAELQWMTWVDTAPDVISSLLPDLANAYVFGPGEADPMLQMLDRARADLLEASADEGRAVMALLAWYGRGAGPWSGYPAYEDIPLLLLQRFPATSIVMALETYAVRLEHLEGGARFFQSRSKASLVPLELRRRLLEHVRATPFPDNVARAEHALGG